MQSSLYTSLTQKSSQRRKGRHVMMPYKNVKDKFGHAIAAQMLADKKQMQKNRSKTDTTTYFMEHPDIKGVEDSYMHCYIFQILACIYCLTITELRNPHVEGQVLKYFTPRTGACYVFGMLWSMRTRMKQH